MTHRPREGIQMGRAISPNRWQQVKAVFGAALEVEPETRAGFVARETAGDEELRREVQSLLDALDVADERFEQTAFASLPDAQVEPAPTLVGTRVGAYVIEREIAHGGMGMVYEARRADDQFQKRVALKMIHRGGDSALILRRFRHERQILARLEHPNIAALLDGGVTETGQPFFAMEFVDGKPIDAHCAEHRLSIRERLLLFRQVCDAVQYAHRNLVVHRDLKPSNILVTTDGNAKLLDFGIAKLLREDETATDGTLTRAGLHPLTTAYASPEQVRGDEVSTTSDVYSLGVVLYELVAGRSPHADSDTGPHELQRRILEDVPARPSAAVTNEGAAGTGLPGVDRLRRALRGELDDIIMTALRKEPERRYASVEQFSEDVRRFLQGLPVSAQKDTAGYRFRKFVQRHRPGVAAAVVACLGIALGIGGTVSQSRRATAQARVAEVERRKAERISAFLQGMLATADPTWVGAGAPAGPRTTIAQVLEGASRRLDSELAEEPDVQAALRRVIGGAYRSLGLTAEAMTQLRAALQLHESMHGPLHADVATDRYFVALTHYVAGNFDSAAAGFREAGQLLARLGDMSSETYMGVVNDYAVLNTMSGNYTLADSLLRLALPAAQARFGAAHPTTAIILGNFGLIHDGRGNLDSAGHYYARALALFDSLPGREWFERPWSLLNLGNVRRMQGQLAEAESLMRRAAEIWGRLVGIDHPYSALPRISLALLYMDLGDARRAVATLDTARRTLQRLAPTHPDIARLETAHGRILIWLGRPGEAEPRLRAALAVRRKSMRPADWRVAETAGTLGEALLAQRRFAEAEPLLLDAYEKTRDALTAVHPRTREALDRLVALYNGARRPEDAARYAALRAR